MSLIGKVKRTIAPEPPAPKASPPMGANLHHDSHIERTKDLDNLKVTLRREHDARKAEHAAAVAKHAAAVAASEAEAEATVQARYAELQNRFCRDFHQAIGPLLKNWFEQPTRQLSNEIGEVCERFNTRALHELGPSHGRGRWALSVDLVASAFTDVLLSKFPNSVNVWQAQGFGLGPIYAQIVQTLPKVTSVGGPALYEQLEQIEAAFISVAAKSSGPVLPDAVRRYEVKRNTATATDLAVAMAALEKTIAAESRARIDKDYASRGARIGT